MRRCGAAHALLAAAAVLLPACSSAESLAWNNTARAWHQQAARIVDHRFSTFTAMQSFARDAKKAGVSILMLVSV